MAGGTQNYQFGSGDLFITGLGTGAFPTPLSFGTLQEVSLDINQSMKELYGKKRMPVAIAGTQCKVQGKAKNALINMNLFSAAFLGGTPAVGEANKTALFEAATPSSGSFTVANAATFVADLGVFDTVTGLWMTKIPSGSPTAGQYKVSAGVYTVFSGDTNLKNVCYTYSVAGSGVKLILPNLNMGANPQFSVYLANGQYLGLELTVELYQCISTKLTLNWKNEDWMIPEFDFSAMDNGTGNWGEFNYDQAA